MERLTAWGRAVLLAGVMLGAGGCAYFALDRVAVGNSMNEVRQAAGAPSSEIRLADGSSVWFYTFLPTGTATYRVRFDAAGKVVDSRQVLSRENFARQIRVGSTTTQQVADEFGPPSGVETFKNLSQVVWTYRSMSGTFVYITNIHFSSRTGVVDAYETYRDRNRDFT